MLCDAYGLVPSALAAGVRLLRDVGQAEGEEPQGAAGPRVRRLQVSWRRLE